MSILPQSGVGGDQPTADSSASAAVSAEVVTAGTDLPPRVLTPAARRALAEAEERRRLRDAAAEARPAEVGGRGGPDPVRYGDWEKGGICWDF
jgi:hypothetical protein